MREFSAGGDLWDAAGTGEVYLTLKLEPDLQLHVPHRLRAGGGAEAGVPRLQAVRIERAVRQVLRVDAPSDPSGSGRCTSCSRSL